MQKTLLLVTAAAFGVVLLASSPARATLLPPPANWHYKWTVVPDQTITLNQTNGTTLHLTDQSTSLPAVGSKTGMIASTITTNSNVTRLTTFSNLFYVLRLTVTDDASHVSGGWSIAGLLSGSIAKGYSSLTNVFLGSATKTPLHLGSYWYTPTVDSLHAPDATHPWRLEVNMEVHHNPEPSSLVLAALGGCCLGAIGWWQWRRRQRVGLVSR